MNVKILDDELYAIEKAFGFMERKGGDAGVDLRAREDVVVPHGKATAIPLGLSIELPENTVGWVTGRSSSHTQMGLIVHEGKIDSGYRGEIHCICTAIDHSVQVLRGERLCQIVVLSIHVPSKWKMVDELSETERGEAGLGSTGRS